MFLKLKKLLISKKFYSKTPLRKKWGWKYEYLKFLFLLLIPLSIVFVTSQPISQKSSRDQNLVGQNLHFKQGIQPNDKFFKTLEEKKKAVNLFLENEKNKSKKEENQDQKEEK